MTSNSNTGDNKERLPARVCLLLQSVKDESVRFCSRRRLSRNSGWWDVVSVNTLRFKLFSSRPIVSSLLPAAKHSNRTHTLFPRLIHKIWISLLHTSSCSWKATFCSRELHGTRTKMARTCAHAHWTKRRHKAPRYAAGSNLVRYNNLFDLNIMYAFHLLRR